MTILNAKDCFLKPKIMLYNNIAKLGNYRGRLLAELEIYPTPRITWEFECFGAPALALYYLDNKLNYPIIGKGFSINEPYIINRSLTSGTEQARGALKGVAPKAIFGKESFKGNSYMFYLPNVRFQEENFVGQGIIDKFIRVSLGTETWEREEGSEGRFITFPIDEDWSIHLETRRDALDWLESKKRNIGTLITTVGQLYRHESDNVSTNKSVRQKLLSMEQAVNRLYTFSFLLSFANGGYIGPLYIEGYRYRKEDRSIFCGSVLVQRTTPLEQIGSTWLTIDSDLIGFLKCLSTFEGMGKLPHWKENFDSILAWYFQAIQPQSSQMSKPLPVVANAIGAALELLSVTILVEEYNIRKLSNLKERIQELLEKIGITEARGYDDIKLHIDEFVDIRNESTHSSVKSKFTFTEKNKVLARAIMWIEEIILWRLGYEGKYRDRTKFNTSISPRYDLTTRDPSW